MPITKGGSCPIEQVALILDTGSKVADDIIV
jgi:hypothetical protein